MSNTITISVTNEAARLICNEPMYQPKISASKKKAILKKLESFGEVTTISFPWDIDDSDPQICELTGEQAEQRMTIKIRKT